MLTHTHARWALLASFALTCILAGSAMAMAMAEEGDDPSGLPTFRSAVSEVRVTFFATDENNRPLEEVTKSDFAVVDNELVVRNFRSFTHSNENSLEIVVLVDQSETVAPRVRTEISDVLQLLARERSIANSNSNSNDNISVVSFGGALDARSGVQPAVLCTNGCRASDSVARLLAVKSGGATPLFDALILAADFISNHRQASGRGVGRDDVRPVLLLFSDGCDTLSMHSANEALQAALNAGALIYSVDMGRTGNPTAGTTFLRQVARATGGRYFPLARPNAPEDDASAVLSAVLDDLRASYVVTYDLPSHQAGFHSLRLLPTHNLKLIFHSRGGYIYDPSDQ